MNKELKVIGERRSVNVGFEPTEAERRHEVCEAGSPLALDNG